MKNLSTIGASLAKPFSTNAGDSLDKLADAPRLLSLLWDKDSQPSLRWLREQQARRTIPFIKIGARVWFQPSLVRGHLLANWGVKRR